LETILKADLKPRFRICAEKFANEMATNSDFNETAFLERLKAIEDWQVANAPPPFNAGDTAWILCSTAFVLMMTLPGLALFYGGMAQVKNVLSTVFQTFSITCLISVLWFMMSYSLAFRLGSPVIGGADRFWLIGGHDSGNQYSPERIGVTTAHPLATSIPETVFMMYQMTFAIITAAIVCGSFAGNLTYQIKITPHSVTPYTVLSAERMKFASMLVFIFFWHFLVYCFVAHSEWSPDGFLFQAGTLDFAGGDVVHVCSGVSGMCIARFYVSPST
jgi:ammonium transporter, Amt family